MNWTIDGIHSHIGFSVKHMMVATVRGQFKQYRGTAAIDPTDFLRSQFAGEIDVASVDTGNEQRDGHLKSADFFDVENNPKITYKSTSVSVKGDEIVTVGDLTIGGHTAPIELVWEFGGVAKDPWGNVKAGFEGTAVINRSDWGITWNAALETGGFLVSDKVTLELEISAIQTA